MALSCFNCSLLSQISFSEFKFISPILNPVHSVHGYTCPVDDMLQLSIPAEHTGCSRYNAGFLHKSFDFVEHRESCSFVYWFYSPRGNVTTSVFDFGSMLILS